MKFRVESKEKGYEYKKKIEKVMSEEGWISLSEVCGIIPGVDSLTDNNMFYGWDDEIRLLRKIRVRQTKEGWWLYLPEPNIELKINQKEHSVSDDELVNLNNIIIDMMNDISNGNKLMEREIEAIDNIRLSMDGMADRIIERWMHYEVDVFTGFEKLGEVIGGHYGYFYRPCIVKAKKSGRKEERQDRNAKFHRWADLSKGVQQVVALVEFEDGHVEQVQPDRVVFKEAE